MPKSLAIATLLGITLPLAPAMLFSQPLNKFNYGLGLPRTAGTGGSVRLKDGSGGGFESSTFRTVPILALMVPEDGAKTASSRPTVYWNMVLNQTQNYKLTFYLHETAEETSKVVLEEEITITKGGLFKYQIPQNLDANVPRRWGVRCRWENGRIVEAGGVVVFREASSELKTSLAQATNLRQKAQLYAQAGYWYDALDAYNVWISANPQDQTALNERAELIRQGFSEPQGFRIRDLIAQINIAPLQEFN